MNALVMKISALTMLFGSKITGPADAYKYAKGETIKHPLGCDIKITN